MARILGYSDRRFNLDAMTKADKSLLKKEKPEIYAKYFGKKKKK